MKRGGACAPRSDATGAPAAAHSGAIALTNQQSSTITTQQSLRAHESPPRNNNQPQSTIGYTEIITHGTQIHSGPSSSASVATTIHPNSVVTGGSGPSVVHISSANLNQIIRPLAAAAPNLTASSINLPTLGSSSVSSQITIPVSAVSVATNQLHNANQSVATNLIIHRQTNQANSQHTPAVNAAANTTISGGSAHVISGTTPTHRFSTLIPKSLQINKGNIPNINQITVTQTTANQLQVSGTNPGSTSVVTPNQTVSLGHPVAGGASVAIATQIVSSGNSGTATPEHGSQPTGTNTSHQIVYTPRISQRIVTTTQQSGGQALTSFSGPCTVNKQTNSGATNTESMQSLAQYQTNTTGYTSGGPSGPGRPPSVTAITQAQLYSANSRANPQVIQVRQRVQSTGGPTPQMTNTSRRLKVEDALSYLDKVKYKFANFPQVYNDFLDIMKEFKSESIDTPGVIERVSSLFKGHPELIEGFNTFLPPGYKIEVKANDQGYAYQVSVSIPSPTQSSTTVVHTSHNQGLSSPPMNTNQVVPNSTGVLAQSTAKSQPSGGTVMQIIQNSGIIHTTISSASSTSAIDGASTGGNASGAGQSQGAIAAATPTITQTHQTAATLPQASPVNLANAASVNIHHSSYQSSGNSVAGNVPHSNNSVHHISQTQAQQAVCQALSQVETGHVTSQNQRVEFNHAINYVNKIKNRFQSQPDLYKRFLEILHTYQKEQRTMKETGTGNGGTSGAGLPHSHVDSSNVSGGKHLTEAEVYSQVAKLFENQEDLLAEFGQFLPDATSQSNVLNFLQRNKTMTNDAHLPKKPLIKTPYNNSIRERERERENRDKDREQREHIREREHRDVVERDREQHRERDREHRDRDRDRNNIVSSQKYGHTSSQIKRSPTYLPPTLAHREGPPMKKHKAPCLRDVTLAEAGKYGTLNDYAFFDKVRKALRSQEVYDNFLRCLVLYNEEVISRSELVQLSSPFLGKFPELFKWFKDFVGHNESGVEPIPNNVVRQERPQGDNALEVDLTTCKRLGASYCALPNAGYSQMVLPPGAPPHLGSLQGSRRCSGRTALCKSVLNDTWVSFPTWSEDSTFVTNRKTQFEEYIYRCEDERFELDVVIETNASTIRVLEGVLRRIQRLSPDELSRFRLDDTLGGTSAVLHQRALRRIYGDKAADIVDGLKRNPGVAVGVVLRRLKAKEEEWREAQKGFNKIWREQNEKYYLKSLDHQGINFKQNDVKSLRSKSLFNEIENLYDERHLQNEDGAKSAAIGAAPTSGPHLILSYAAHLTPNSSTPATPVVNNTGPHQNGIIERSVLDDAAGLLIHHVRRQTAIQKQEKARIKALLRQFIPDLFHHPRQQLSDDERDDDDDKEEDSSSRSSPNTLNDSKTNSKSNSPNSNRKTPPKDSDSNRNVQDDENKDIDLDLVKVEEDERYTTHLFGNDPDEYYTLFMANNNWYLFLRLHAVLCSRLATIHAHAQRLIEQEKAERSKRKQSTAAALRLKPQPEVEVEQYYPAFLDMVKNVLDGNMESNAYEDTLREMFGIHAYIAFTLDKVVSYAVRQLQHCATERGAIECCNMFLNERRKAHPSYNASTGRKESLRDKDFFKNLSKDVYSLLRLGSNNLRSGADSYINSTSSGAGGACASAYRRRAAEISYQKAAENKLRDENCFKIYIYKNSLRVTIELLDTETDDPDPESTLSEAQKRSNYIDRFANEGLAASGSSETNKSSSTASGRSGGAGGVNDNNSGSNQNTIKSENSGKNSSIGASDKDGHSSGVSEKGTRKRFDRDRELSVSECKEEKNLSDQDESEHGVDKAFRSTNMHGRKPTFLKRNLRVFKQRTQRGSKQEDNQEEADDSQMDDSEHKDVDDIMELERKLNEKGPPQRMNATNVTDDFIVDDKTQCRFNLNSYKMVYIVNKESYLYKKDAFTKARECHPVVTKRLNSKFKSWLKRWVNTNVTEAQQKATCDWLMGRTEGLCSNKTRVITNNDIRRTPYVSYNRYRVERLVFKTNTDNSG